MGRRPGWIAEGRRRTSYLGGPRPLGGPIFRRHPWQAAPGRFALPHPKGARASSGDGSRILADVRHPAVLVATRF